MKTSKKLLITLTLSVIAAALLITAFVSPSVAENVRYLLGDVNSDNEVNTGDAVLVLRFANDLITLTDLQKIVGDANANGELNTGDAAYILRIALGLEQQGWIVINTSSPESPTPTQTDVAPTNTPAVTPTATIAPTATATIAPTATIIPTATPTADPNGYAYEIVYVYSHANMNTIQTVTGKKTAGEFEYTPLSPLTLPHTDANGNVRGFTPEYGVYSFTVSATEENVFYIYCNEMFSNESGRSGSSWADAIIIRKPADLLGVNTYNGVNKYYIMGADVDLSSVYSWSPIGSFDIPFSGGFDGYGYAISDMKITPNTITVNSYNDAYAGLFGSLSNALLRHVDVHNATIDLSSGSTNTYSMMYTGIIAGSSYNSVLEDCSSSGTVKCVNMGPGGTGGIIGSTWHSSRTSSESSKVGSLTRCHSTATVSSNRSMVAGIAGACNLSITECWFNGSAISTGNCVGGICGYFNTSVSECKIENCWTGGLVQGEACGGTNPVGGIAGYATQPVYGCYSVAKVNSLVPVNASMPYCQPLVGGMSNNITVKDSYFLRGNFYVNNVLNYFWDNGSTFLRGVGYSKEQMTNRMNFGAWDASIWFFPTGEYPQLVNNPTT